MKFKILLFFTIVCLIWPEWAAAEAKNGPSLNLEIGEFGISDVTTGESYQSSVVGGGLDYQWALGKKFSMLLGYKETAGGVNIPTEPLVETAKAVRIKAEIRMWAGELYLGISSGLFRLFFVEQGTAISETSNTATGYGAVVGWEGMKGHLFSLQYEAAERMEMHSNLTVNLSGVLLQYGYRWK